MTHDSVNIMIKTKDDEHITKEWSFYRQGNGSIAIDADFLNGISGIYLPEQILYFNPAKLEWCNARNEFEILKAIARYEDTRELVYDYET